MTKTLSAPPATNHTTASDERQAQILAKMLRKKHFATLATVSPKGRPHNAGVIYDFADCALWVHTMRHSRKGANIAAHKYVAISVPFRKIPVGPPYTIHFQARAELVALDDPEALRLHEAGALDSISGHGAMEMAGACFLRITPIGIMHSFGPGVPVLDLARDPINNGSRSVPAAAVLAV